MSFRPPAESTAPSGARGVRVNQLDVVELASQPPNLVLEKLNLLPERDESPEGCGSDHQNRNTLSFVHISQSRLYVDSTPARSMLCRINFAAPDQVGPNPTLV